MNKSDYVKMGGIAALSAVLLAPLPQMVCTGQLSQAGLYAASAAVSASVAAAVLALTHKRSAASQTAATAV